MKLHETAVIQNLEDFILPVADRYDRGTTVDILRTTFSVFIFWSIFNYFKPNRMVEVGFGGGQTFGLMVDSGASDLTSVDLLYNNKSIFDQHYSGNNVSFNKTDSALMEYSGQFDFIHIDGDHTFKGAETDLLKLLKHTHDNTIIAMDDFIIPDIAEVINIHLMNKHGFVPFMQDSQCMFFHKETHDANTFIDEHLFNGLGKKFAIFSNTQVGDYTVLTGFVPDVFQESLPIFRSTLEFYDI